LITESEKDNIQVLFNKFEAHCIPKQNVTVLRFKFNTRNQENESIDQYVTELRKLAKDCAFGSLKEDLIKDIIVCGKTTQ